MISFIKVDIFEDVVKSYFAAELEIRLVESHINNLRITAEDKTEKAGIIFIFDLRSLAFNHYLLKAFKQIYLESISKESRFNCIFQIHEYQKRELLIGLLLLDSSLRTNIETIYEDFSDKGAVAKLMDNNNNIQVLVKNNPIVEKILIEIESKGKVTLEDLMKVDHKQIDFNDISDALDYLVNNKCIYKVDKALWISITELINRSYE
jgi:hypothetical protein